MGKVYNGTFLLINCVPNKYVFSESYTLLELIELHIYKSLTDSGSGLVKDLFVSLKTLQKII